VQRSRPVHPSRVESRRNLTQYEQSTPKTRPIGEVWIFERMPAKTLRLTVFIMVLLLHLGTLAVLLAHSQTERSPGIDDRAIELLALPPVEPPKVKFDHTRVQPWSTNIVVALAPSVLNSSSQSGPGSALDGRGPTVNWAAEAHRAVRAFEIRGHQTKNSALSVSSSLDETGSREHHAGDQLKTSSGDWIVWINANCYQIASWHSDAPDFSAISPKIICRKPTPPPPKG
jgi:hypothetical protein